MTYQVIAVAVIIVILLAVACIALSAVICKPIHALTDLLNEMSELKFGQNEVLTKLGARKDETGVMARAMHVMRQNLCTMIQEIVGISNQTKSDVNGLAEISDKISQMCEDNSATSEQLAAGMQETSATTMGINEHVGVIKIGANQISNTAFAGAQMSDEVMERATSLKDKTVSASQNTLQIYNEVKGKAENAITGAQEVEKINVLINSIMDISSQTNLLALNASIEAARAGEAGKGFAVVASEIGALANQTSDTVKDIGNVVEGVNAAVGNMIQCLKHTLDFLDNTVLVEYKEFEGVSVQYQQDAGAFKDSMAQIRDKAVELADAIENIVSAVEGINTTVEESATGVTNVAEKTSSMVEKTNEAHEMASECYACADKLRTLMDKFTLS